MSSSFADNEVLDEFTIPFGVWIDQAVDWVVNNLKWLLDAIGWPFEFLIDLLVDDVLMALPWFVVVLGMSLLAWVVRNLNVAVLTAVGLTVCGLLGNGYWEQTMTTIGLITVSVVVCVAIGIPVGILAGRFDSVWQITRPTLDAMQVIHAFVYLLPFVYFWGIGAVAATMATMVFALPPLIRLTNLGIRQVPEDVVEAARSYGATEMRVLRDVQLPLARPAIMTGINQTLLLAFSMMGVAAILGAGGLGQLLFRAIGQQDVSLAAASGLAFFILAVVLDRISQPGAGAQRSLLSRLGAAWQARATPEDLLTSPDFNPELAAEPRAAVNPLATISSRERTAVVGVGIGGALMAISPLFTWANDAALLTGYSRRADEQLPGESFVGYSAQGGSWFAFGVALLGIASVASVITIARGRRVHARWLAPDGALMFSIGGLIAAVGYLVIQPSVFSVGYQPGIGAYLAAAAAAIATTCSVAWVAVAPQSPRRPLRQHVTPGPLVVVGLGVGVALISVLSSWVLDERADVVITPELQAEIDELREQARAGDVEPGVAATQIQVIRASAEAAEEITLSGLDSDGPQIGIWVLAVAVVGAAGASVAAGLTGLGDRRRWVGGTVAMGSGLGLLMIAVGWTGSLARATDPNFFSGFGTLMAAVAGILILNSSKRLVESFERSTVFDDAFDIAEQLVSEAESRGAESPLVGV